MQWRIIAPREQVMKPISRGAGAPITLGQVLFCILLLVGTAVPAASAQEPEEMEATLQKMLGAIQTKSLANFVEAGDASFRSGMSQAMLDGVNTQFGPRLKQGYSVTFVGRLNQQGYAVYLWKLEFKDGGDDRLVTMAVKNRKIGLFVLR
jgi:hypothetical protein